MRGFWPIDAMGFGFLADGWERCLQEQEGPARRTAAAPRRLLLPIGGAEGEECSLCRPAPFALGIANGAMSGPAQARSMPVPPHEASTGDRREHPGQQLHSATLC